MWICTLLGINSREGLTKLTILMDPMQAGETAFLWYAHLYGLNVSRGRILLRKDKIVKIQQKCKESPTFLKFVQFFIPLLCN